MEQIPTTGEARYLHQDQLGSTRLLSDGGGNIQATYSYDAYGNTTAKTGTSSSAFQYAGEYADAESGFYYLRARYYDPATAQFLSRDPAVTLTRSPHGYVSGNPLNGSDPSGMIDPSELSQWQVDQINHQCSTWQNQSMCRQAAFCSGDNCHTLGQIAVDNSNLVERALEQSPCGDVTLAGGYRASHREALRDLVEMRAAFQVAVGEIDYENHLPINDPATVVGASRVATGAASCAVGALQGAQAGATGVYVPGYGWVFEGFTTVLGCGVGVGTYLIFGARYQR